MQKILVILMLLICSGSYCKSNSTFLYGRADSISISIDDVRKLNDKMIELDISKQKLKVYEELDRNNKSEINVLKDEIQSLNKSKKRYKKISKYSLILNGGFTLLIILLI